MNLSVYPLGAFGSTGSASSTRYSTMSLGEDTNAAGMYLDMRNTDRLDGWRTLMCPYASRTWPWWWRMWFAVISVRLVAGMSILMLMCVFENSGRSASIICTQATLDGAWSEDDHD